MNVFFSLFTLFFLTSFSAYSFPLYIDKNQSSLITRSPICDPAGITEALRYLHVLEDVKTNEELKIAIINNYSVAVWDHLEKTHPYLRVATGRLDTLTIDWFIDAITRVPHKRLKKLVIPFLSLDEASSKSIINDVLGNAIKGYLSTQIVFLHERWRSAFRRHLENFGKATFANYYASRTEVLLSHVPLNIRYKWGVRLFDDLMTSNMHVVVGGDNNADLTFAIDIWGHGNAGKHGITNGSINKPENLTSAQLIQRLKENNLINNNTKVNLTSCNSADGLMSERLPLSVDDIKGKFRKKELIDYIKRISTDSFAQSVRDEITAQIPSHSAAVVGYFGKMYGLPKPNTLFPDGTTKFAYAVEVTADDGSIVLLHRSDMRLKLLAEK